MRAIMTITSSRMPESAYAAEDIKAGEHERIVGFITPLLKIALAFQDPLQIDIQILGDDASEDEPK